MDCMLDKNVILTYIFWRSAVNILTSESKFHQRNRYNIQNNYMDYILDQIVGYQSLWSSTVNILIMIGVQHRNHDNV